MTTSDQVSGSGVPESSGGAWRIALISGAVLILELTFIRQVPAEVRVISYFTNLLLISAFFGLGLGCILQDRRPLGWLLPLGVALMFGFILGTRGLLIFEETRSVHYWLNYTNVEGQAPDLPIFPTALAAFIIGSLPFIAMGQALAVAMNRHRRLVAYGWDIAGSLIGTLLFSVSSFFHVPPWIWPPLLMILWSVFFLDRWAKRVLFTTAGLLFLILSQSIYPCEWSPYYFVQYRQEESGLRIWVNSSFHQLAVDLESDAPDLKKHQDQLVERLGIPYEEYRKVHNGVRPKRILVLGAGTGNDVNVAIRNHASQIVAVEIDPTILALGKRYNTSKPYDDPRVRTVVDDARHFLRTSTETFDLILLGTLDSQTLLSGKANLRLENYVYTTGAFQDIKRLLADDGMMAAYYSVYTGRAPWLYGRLFSTVRSAFGDRVRILFTDLNFVFNTIILAAPGIEEFEETEEVVAAFGGALPSTDDWPYLYLEHPTIAPIYLKLFGSILLLITLVFVLLRRIHPVRGLHGNFLFLGLGFTLMESASIVRLSLLFGSTWMVSAIVFTAVLCTIFVANLLVLIRFAPTLNQSWIGLAISILVMYFFPLPLLFEIGSALRVFGAGLLVGVPVFFAAICFSRLFEAQKTTGYALGINLVGAMAGGLIEYVSMLIGMRSVWLIVLVLYLLAYVFTVRASRQATASRALKSHHT